MISSKIIFYVPIVSAIGFCVSSICRCGLKEYIRRRTHNRNDQRTLMHLRHTEDNEEQQLIKKYPSINDEIRSRLENHEVKRGSEQEKKSGNTSDKISDSGSSTNENEGQELINNPPLKDDENRSRFENYEVKQESDYLEKSGDTRDKISDSGSSTNEKEEQELINNSPLKDVMSKWPTEIYLHDTQDNERQELIDDNPAMNNVPFYPINITGIRHRYQKRNNRPTARHLRHTKGNEEPRLIGSDKSMDDVPFYPINRMRTRHRYQKRNRPRTRRPSRHTEEYKRPHSIDSDDSMNDPVCHSIEDIDARSGNLATRIKSKISRIASNISNCTNCYVPSQPGTEPGNEDEYYCDNQGFTDVDHQHDSSLDDKDVLFENHDQWQEFV